MKLTKIMNAVVNRLTWNEVGKIAFVDALCLAALYSLTALAHVISFPLYYLDPMRLALLLGFVFTLRKGNAYLLAVTLPLFAFVTTGMPAVPKLFLIMIELATNVALLSILWKKAKLNVVLAVFLSIVGSKLLYYGLKYAFISFGWMTSGLVSTALWIQAVVAVALTAVCILLFKWRKVNR